MPERVAWRIDKEKRITTSFNGEGASKEGGRWNSAGIRIVYASASLAMAAQEKYVHLPKPIPETMKLVQFRITFDYRLVVSLRASHLPADWRRPPPHRPTQAIGDQWATARQSAVLAVPSALIPEETNYLINPAHPDFEGIKINPPEVFEFDYRISGLLEP